MVAWGRQCGHGLGADLVASVHCRFARPTGDHIATPQKGRAHVPPMQALAEAGFTAGSGMLVAAGSAAEILAEMNDLHSQAR